MRSPARTVHPTRSPRPAGRLRATAALLALAVVALGGCGAGDSADSAVADSDAAPAAGSGAELTSKAYDQGDGAAVSEEQSRNDTVGGAAPAPGAAGSTDVAASVADRQLARRADISVTVKDVDAAATKVRAIASAAKGLVLSESVASESDIAATGGFSSITISVPTDQLDATLDKVAEIGKVHSRNTSTEDVTAQVVDTQSRLKTMQASVDRVRALMLQATKLGEIVTLEAELSRRQADLEALQSQLASLQDSVALAPVEVRLSTDEQVLADAVDDTGFLAGLAAGWRAFTGSVTVLLTVLGALLPFAVAGMLVIAPVVMWLRRRRATGADPVPVGGLVPAAAGSAVAGSAVPGSSVAGSSGAGQTPPQPPATS